MKKIKSILAIGTSLFFLTASGCMTNPGKTDGKAELTDYLGIPQGINYSEQVKVYDNYVEIQQLIHKSHISVKRITQYSDYNKDGDVDTYYVDDSVIGHTDGKIVVYIASKKVWENNSLQGTIVKYTDKELQEIINKDYETLRQKGVRESGEISSSIKAE